MPNFLAPQIEDVDAEINRYKKDVDEITKSGGVSSLEELDPKYILLFSVS